ncbi:MAG TPA: tyrosine-type recombinase/integrase [Thermoflexia bacterium]|nr:tyrosine-type recombinase/integrase [Thermoflexia bacterium]
MEWQKTLEAYLRTLRESTANQYRLALADFHRWYVQTYGEEPAPALLTDEEAREYVAYLSGVRNLKAATVNLRLSALKGLARFCGRRLTVRGVRKVEQPIEPLNGRELGRLIAAVEGFWWGAEWMKRRNVAIIALLARAGLRVGEVVALDVEDVELNERSGWVLVRRGKGLKERHVPLSKEARKALGAYLEKRPWWTEEAALFVTRTGQRMDVRAVQRMVEAATQRAGIAKRVTPHVLRHTFATRFLRRGGDLATLQAILGHANLATTARYLHPDAARVQEMVESL